MIACSNAFILRCAFECALCSSGGVGGGGFQATYLKGNLVVTLDDFHWPKPQWLIDWLMGWTFLWGQWSFWRAFAWVCMDTFWFVLCLVEDLCTRRGNPTILAAAWVGWLEKAVTSVPCLVPLYFLGVKEKRSRALQWFPARSWHCNDLPLYMIMHPGPDAQCQAHGPPSQGYGMTHALTWRWRKLWQFIGFNSWECSPIASRKHTRERVWGASLPVSKNLMTN